MKLLSVTAVGLAMLASATMSGAEPLSASIAIDAASVVGPTNRLALGQNLEAGDTHGIFSDRPGKSNDGQGFWDPDTRGFVPGFLQKAKDLRMGALRYPGGCLAHNFDWKKTIGPLSERPNFQFGLDEFLKLCAELGAEPVIIVSDYAGTDQDAADLVEYLNAPAVEGHVWAKKRAENGHPEPYRVTWFELGNESYHGNHDVKPFRVFSPMQYADYAKRYSTKMKAVDSGIKVGINAVPGNTTNIDTEWNRVVFQEAAAHADFVALHFYTPSIADKLSLTPEGQAHVQEACLAIGAQVSERLRQYRAFLQEHGGRDLPLAITEYNVGAATQQKPYPYRFTFVGALFAADMVRICLQPENGVALANYWQLANGYWSMINTYPGRVAERPVYPLYRLWGQNLGNEIVASTVQSPTAAFSGYPGVAMAQTVAGGEAATAVDLVLPPQQLPVAHDKLAITVPESGRLEFRFTNYQGEAYPEIFEVKRPADSTFPVDYGLSFEARIVADDGSTVKDIGTIGLGLVDSRGWEASGSAVALSGVENASDWRAFQGKLNALSDAGGVTIVGRLNIKKPFTGKLEIRNVKLRALPKEVFPEYPLLTAITTKSGDGDLRLIVFNKSLHQEIKTEIRLANFAAKSATFYEVKDSPISTTAAKVREGDLLPVRGDLVTHTFPPLSMTVVAFQR